MEQGKKETKSKPRLSSSSQPTTGSGFDKKEGSSKKKDSSQSRASQPGATNIPSSIQLAAGNHDSITADGSSALTGNDCSIVSPRSSSISLAPPSEPFTEVSVSPSPRSSLAGSKKRISYESQTSPSRRGSRKKKDSIKGKKEDKTLGDGVDDDLLATKLGAVAVPWSNEDMEETLNQRREEDHWDDVERGLPDSANPEPFVASARLVRDDEDDEDDNNPDSLPENLEKKILSIVESQLRKNDVVMAEAVRAPGSSAPGEEGKICGLSRWTCRMVAVLTVLVVVGGIVAGVVVATNDNDDPPAVPSPSITPQTTFAPFSIFDEIPA